jgi:hypothetical protein
LSPRCERTEYVGLCSFFVQVEGVSKHVICPRAYLDLVGTHVRYSIRPLSLIAAASLGSPSTRYLRDTICLN